MEEVFGGVDVEGKFLKDLGGISIAEGTLLVMDHPGVGTFYFELLDNYSFSAHNRNTMQAVPGSVINSSGIIQDGSKTVIIPHWVRFPYKEEESWYNTISSV